MMRRLIPVDGLVSAFGLPEKRLEIFVKKARGLFFAAKRQRR